MKDADNYSSWKFLVRLLAIVFLVSCVLALALKLALLILSLVV